MKTGKLKGVTTVEAAGIIVHLGGRVNLYRDVPLLSETQIPEVVEEFKANKCDSILFDTGAVFDAVAYDLATKCVKAIQALTENKNGTRKHNYLPVLKVVIYNVPSND